MPVIGCRHEFCWVCLGDWGRAGFAGHQNCRLPEDDMPLRPLPPLPRPAVVLILNAVKKSWICRFQIEISRNQKGVKSTCTDLAIF